VRIAHLTRKFSHIEDRETHLASIRLYVFFSLPSRFPRRYDLPRLASFCRTHFCSRFEIIPLTPAIDSLPAALGKLSSRVVSFLKPIPVNIESGTYVLLSTSVAESCRKVACFISSRWTIICGT